MFPMNLDSGGKKAEAPSAKAQILAAVQASTAAKAKAKTAAQSLIPIGAKVKSVSASQNIEDADEADSQNTANANEDVFRAPLCPCVSFHQPGNRSETLQIQPNSQHTYNWNVQGLCCAISSSGHDQDTPGGQVDNSGGHSGES